MAIPALKRSFKRFLPRKNEDPFSDRTEVIWALVSESDVQLEIGRVLFIDVVGYSKLLLDEQRELQHQLTRLVRNTEQCAPRKRWATDSASRQQWFFTNNYR